MNTTKIIVTAVLAIAASSAFAETGSVATYQTASVAQVYGRASAPIVSVTGRVADSGQDVAKGDTKVAVTARKEAIEFGRS